MANAINDIIKQSVNNITNMQQANQQLQSILGQSQNKRTTGSQQLPSNLVLSPKQVSLYDYAMNDSPQDTVNDIRSLENNSNYPELKNMLSNLSQQGSTALQGYISKQQSLAPSLFANTWEKPNQDTSSINISLAGNQPKNKIMQQYESKYNEMQQQLDTQKQNYLSQLETMRTNIQNSLNQLANTDTATALVLGTTATYLQNAYNRIAPYMQPGDYERLTQQLQDAYSKDQQFATSYNQLFQNYLSMNVNLIDMLKQVQANTFSGIQQGANQANQQYIQQWGQRNVFNIPNVNDMNSAINAQHLQQTIDFANQHYGMTPEQWEQYQEQQNEGSAGG
jgi:hypothetical protein